MPNYKILTEESITHLKDVNNKCVECKKCYEYCSFYTKHQLSPKENVSGILNSLDSLSKSYDCNSCGYCKVSCPADIDHAKSHKLIKKDIVSSNKKLPNRRADNVVNFHQNTTHSKLFNHGTKGFTSNVSRKVFFPGCALIGFSPDTVLNIYEYLTDQNDNIGIMSYCCGKPNESIGKDSAFKNNFKIIIDDIRKYNIEEIITACPNCYMTLKKQLKDVKVTHITSSLLKYGLPIKSVNIYNQNITIHDPCPLRNENDIHDNIREIITQLGLKINNREFSKSETLCCGSGAMIRVVSPVTAKKYTDKFIDTFNSNDLVITYCQECVQILSSNNVRSQHILSVIFDDSNFEQNNISSLKKLTNRFQYKTKIILKKGLS